MSFPGTRIIGARLRAFVVLAVALALLGGCSALRFAYGQAPTIAYWWLDGYVGFEDGQTRQARAAIDDWFRWQHREEVPVYLNLLERMQDEVRQPATAEQACRWADVLRERARVAAERAIPPAVEIARTLSPAQIERVRAKQRKNDEDFLDEYLQSDPERRRKAAVQRTLDRIEMLYGRFDASQRDQVARWVAASPFDAERWNAERHQRQADLIAALERVRQPGTPAAEAEGALRELFDDAVDSPREAYRDYQRTLLAYNCRFVADVHNLATPEQRQAAARRLQGWAEDLRAVAGADGS